MRRFVLLVVVAMMLVGLMAGPALAGNIGSPTEWGVIYSDTLSLEATDSEAEGDVQWAVRKGTSAKSEGAVAGNVDGFNDDYDWDEGNFAATLDISEWDAGEYYFVFNPVGNGDNDRLVQPFYIADGRVAGGGQILEGDYKVSFGGSAYRIGSGSDADGVGSWSVTFHDVGQDDVNKTTFEGDDVYAMNFFSDGEVANLKIDGSWNGEPGYTLIVRAEDGGEPGTDDNIRFELWKGSTLVYDTNSDFSGESDNVGTNRTGLDRGNLQVDTM